MRFGIIGGGPASVAILDRIVQSAEKGTLSTNSSITIFEKSGEFALGTPYTQKLNHPDLRVNIATVEPAISDHGEDFHEWLSSKTPEELAPMGITQQADGTISEDACYSRVAAMGVYLQDYAAKLIERAKALGIEVDVRLNSEVTDMRLLGDTSKRLTIKTPEGTGQEDFDAIWLGLGHWYDKDPEHKPGELRVFNSPWPGKKITDTVPKGTTAAVIGTGPSGADATLMLAHHNGEFSYDESGKCKYTVAPGNEGFKVKIGSRSGYLPQLRAPIDMEEYVTEDDILAHRDPATGFLSLDGMFEVFKGDMKARYPDFAAKVPNLDGMTFVEFAKWLEKDQFMSKGTPVQAFKDSIAESTIANDAGTPLAPQDVFINLYVFSEVHKYLSAEEKLIFNTQIKPIISKVSAPLPPEIAEKLEAMIDAGVLDVGKLSADKLSVAALKGHVDTVIISTGQKHDIRNHPAQLVQNMLKRGLLSEQLVEFQDQPNAAKFAADNGVTSKLVERDGKSFMNIGGIGVDDNYNALDAKGEPVPGLYYVGPNCVRPFDAYALIFSRDASILVESHLQEEWNRTADLLHRVVPRPPGDEPLAPAA